MVPSTSISSPEYVYRRVSEGCSGGRFAAVHVVRYVWSLMRDTDAPVSTSMVNAAPFTVSSTRMGGVDEPVH